MPTSTKTKPARQEKRVAAQTYLDTNVLAHLRAENRPILDLEQDRSWLQSLTPHYYVLLHRMAEKGLLHRLQGGRYAAELSGHPAKAPAFRTLEPLAPAILRSLGQDYYLSWHTALAHYGLIEAPSSTIFAATAKRKRPAEFSGYAVRFIPVSAERVATGNRQLRLGSSTVRIATVERALVDAFDRPRYAGPFAVVASALREAWELGELRPEVLVDEVILLGRHSAARRIGFFMERWQIPEADRLLPHLGRGYAVSLAPGGQNYEPGLDVDSRWGVVVDQGLIYTAEHLK